MSFSPETIRRKKMFIGHLRSFIKRHDLSHVEAARILGVKNSSSVSNWLNDVFSPQLPGIEKYRKNMRIYDEMHKGAEFPQDDEEKSDDMVITGVSEKTRTAQLIGRISNCNLSDEDKESLYEILIK